MPLTREDLQSIEGLIENALRSHWEHIVVPWMSVNFVSKKDLKEEFEQYDMKMEQRFIGIEQQFITMREETQSIKKELVRVRKSVWSIQKNLKEHRDYTEIKFESHSRAIREIHGVAEPKVHYITKTKTKRNNAKNQKET